MPFPLAAVLGARWPGTRTSAQPWPGPAAASQPGCSRLLGSSPCPAVLLHPSCPRCPAQTCASMLVPAGLLIPMSVGSTVHTVFLPLQPSAQVLPSTVTQLCAVTAAPPRTLCPSKGHAGLGAPSAQGARCCKRQVGSPGHHRRCIRDRCTGRAAHEGRINPVSTGQRFVPGKWTLCLASLPHSPASGKQLGPGEERSKDQILP